MPSPRHDIQGLLEVPPGEALHPDEQAAAMARTSRPSVHAESICFPAPQVEIPDAKVGLVGDDEDLRQAGGLIDIVEDSGHVVAVREIRPSHRHNAPKRAS